MNKYRDLLHKETQTLAVKGSYKKVSRRYKTKIPERHQDEHATQEDSPLLMLAQVFESLPGLLHLIDAPRSKRGREKGTNTDHMQPYNTLLLSSSFCQGLVAAETHWLRQLTLLYATLVALLRRLPSRNKV